MRFSVFIFIIIMTGIAAAVISKELLLRGYL